MQENNQLGRPVQEFVDSLTSPISSEMVDMTQFEMPERIEDISRDDPQLDRILKDLYRVFGGSCFVLGKSQSSAMSYMTSVKNQAIVSG